MVTYKIIRGIFIGIILKNLNDIADIGSKINNIINIYNIFDCNLGCAVINFGRRIV